MSRTPSQQHYWNTIAKILGDRELRIFLWRLIVEDCRVFAEGFPVNAAAYCLLAKQEIGKRLLADAKVVDADAVLQAEKEYNALMELNQKVLNQQEEGEA